MQGVQSPSSYGPPAVEVPSYVAIAAAAKATQRALDQRAAEERRQHMLRVNPHLDPDARDRSTD